MSGKGEFSIRSNNNFQNNEVSPVKVVGQVAVIITNYVISKLLVFQTKK